MEGIVAGPSQPTFFMPFPAQLNPAMADSATRMHKWSDQFGLRPTPEARRHRQTSRPELYIARSYPDADPDILALLTQWIEWGFVIDDELDDGPLGRSVTDCQAAITGLLAVIDEDSDPRNAIARALQDLWRRTTVARSTSWARRFLADLRAWLWTYHTETVHRVTGQVPTIEEYRIHSRNAAGMQWFMDLCETAVDVDLPDRIAYLPSFTSMRLAVVEHAAFLNDIISAPKETPFGGVHNAVTILRTYAGVTLDQAVANVNDMATECVTRFLAARTTFDIELTCCAVDRELHDGACRCAQGFAALLRGIYDWHLEVERYQHVLPLDGSPDYLTDLFWEHRDAEHRGHADETAHP